MNDPPKETEDRELIDMLIAISVVSRHLARKLEMKGSEEVTECPDTYSAESSPAMTKEEARAMLADLARNGHREEAKALVAKYAGGGSFSDIDPQRYPELAEEVKKIHG